MGPGVHHRVMTMPAARTSAARVAVTVAFFSHGALSGTWAARIPQIRDALGLSDPALGLGLLAVAAGAVSSMTLTGGLVARFGSRTVTLLGLLVMCAGLVCVGLSPSFALAVPSLLAFGVGMGTMDVAMNAHGVTVEGRMQRPILSGLHGLWSLGAMAGAAVGGLAAGAGVPVPLHFLAVAGVLGLAGFAVRRAMLPGAVDRVSRTPWFQLPPRAMLGLGLLCFGSLLAEGSVSDWSAVLLSGTFGADAASAAFGYAAFSLVMTAGRLSGDAVVARVGPVALTRGGALLTAAALGTLLVVGDAGVAILGLALMGAGLASMVPVIFRAAAHQPGVPAGTGIAAVSLLGYLGFLAGPPLIGFAAGQVGLRAALGGVVLLLFLMAALAGRTEVGDAGSRGASSG
jgi:Major Facilitator Superfamily